MREAKIAKTIAIPTQQITQPGTHQYSIAMKRLKMMPSIRQPFIGHLP